MKNIILKIFGLKNTNVELSRNTYYSSFYLFFAFHVHFIAMLAVLICTSSHLKEVTNLIAFFYINRRKYWFRANFRFPVFDEITRFGMS